VRSATSIALIVGRERLVQDDDELVHDALRQIARPRRALRTPGTARSNSSPSVTVTVVMSLKRSTSRKRSATNPPSCFGRADD